MVHTTAKIRYTECNADYKPPEMMMIAHRSVARRYGLALLASAIAFGTAVAFDRPLMELAPFLLFYAAVAVSSWYGGFGPGIVVIAFGAVAVDYYLFDPPNSFALRKPSDIARFSLFLLVGMLISWLNGQLLTSKRRCEISEREARRSEARSKRLSEANMIAVFFSELNGKVHAGNDEFLRLAGCTRKEVQRNEVNWLTLTPPEYRPLDEKALEELQTCRVCTPYEREHVLRDGRRIPVLVGCAMLDDPPDECVGFALDLTDRKRVEQDLRAHQKQLVALSSELMLAEERERRRIATVLHDSIGQTLAVAKLQLGATAESELATAVAGRLMKIQGLIDETISRTRSLTSEISPPVLYEIGLEAAVRWLAGRAREQHGLNVEVQDDNQAKPLSPAARLVVFEAVRELLFNVVKHAKARTCTVSIGCDGSNAIVVVQDDGTGFCSTEENHGNGKADGFGLFNIRERVSALGGQMKIQAQAGIGSSVTLIVPLSSVTTERTVI